MDELTGAQIAALEEALRTLEGELEEALMLGADAAKPVELDQQAVGRLSRMDAMQQQAMAQSNKRSAELRLKQVRAALSAIESGDYGYCQMCDEPIAHARLQARPESPFCLACQGRRERPR